MNYLSQNSQKINVFEVEHTLDIIDVNPLELDSDLSNYNVIGKIENILPGKYTVIKNIVSQEMDELDMTQAIYAHVFVLHESIANLPLNDHEWKKNKMFFNFLANDDTYVAMVSSHEGIKEFKKQNHMSEKTYVDAEMVESLPDGLMFSNPHADYGQEIEYLKLNDKIVGFRIQGVGKIYDIEIPNNKQKLKT